MNDRLFVYDASAGSGKTYNLAERFSDYLIEEHRKGRSDAHRRVVAVTFTNKATFEMKSEIIKKLYKRSVDPSYEYRKDAETVLRELVHDYTMFRVSTIDSFFQKVLRAFALELGSSSSYDTSLDSQSAVEAALDSIYSKLGSDKKLLGVMEKI
ncbi:MAG: UvrD-helicase domain-containing protein, partial [Bacteroidales bacterium]|nr:UvrD-helicase domain-containing protein [Bacteroidales bacterium]